MTAAIVVGLGFGDEGKGAMTDFLVRESGASTVVRWNGGPQCGHNVVTPGDDGRRWHCFAQFGAGTFVGNTRTVLGPDMLVELEALASEADALAGKGVRDPLGRIAIDPGCTVITPLHKLVNQLGELAARRGSCGMGVGQAVRWRERGLALRVRDVAARTALPILQQLCAEAFAAADALLVSGTPEMQDVRRYFATRCDPQALATRYAEVLERVTIAPVDAPGSVVFEGAQGALLDRMRGFVPYVTQSRTTAHGAAELRSDATRIGVARAYQHRHGLGPLVTEDMALAHHLGDPFNRENRWQGAFRVGHLDLVALRYGVALNERIDTLAITGLDRLAGLAEIRACTAYEIPADANDKHFAIDDRGRAIAIRTPMTIEDARELAQVLARCRPASWTTWTGCPADITSAGALGDLPSSARAVLDAIAGALSVPIGFVSVGPDAYRKFAVH